MPTPGFPNGVVDEWVGVPPADAFRDGSPQTLKPALIVDRLTNIIYTRNAAGSVAAVGVDPNITYDATYMMVTAPVGLGLTLGANGVGGATAAIVLPPANNQISLNKLTSCGSAFFTARVFPAYGPSVSISTSNGNVFRIIPTDGVAFAIANAICSAGQQIVITIKNTFGVLGAVTWGSVYKLSAAWVNPANGFQRTISFVCEDALTLIEVSRNTTDVPN